MRRWTSDTLSTDKVNFRKLKKIKSNIVEKLDDAAPYCFFKFKKAKKTTEKEKKVKKVPKYDLLLKQNFSWEKITFKV